MRVAIGAVRGAPLRRAILVLFVLSVLGVIAGGFLAYFVDDEAIGMVSVGVLLSTSFLCLYLFMPATASRAGVEAERAWVQSLPFALERYFDVIGAVPEDEVRLRVDLWWTAQGVDPRTLQGIVALFDPRSTVAEAQGACTSFTTGPISGSTGITVNDSSVYRNHRLSKTVHRLVDVVLMPIHRNRPLASVRLSRA